MTRPLLAILAAAIWINASEFFRNEWLLKRVWQDHFAGLGLTFPSAPVNGVLWLVWGLGFAVLVHLLTRRFPLSGSTAIAWLSGFVLMWLVTYNLSVLPLGIAFAAVPLSLLEAFGAAWLCRRIDPPEPARP